MNPEKNSRGVSMGDPTRIRIEPGHELVRLEPGQEASNERITRRFQKMQMDDQVQSNPKLKEQLGQISQIVNSNKPFRRPLGLTGVLSMNVKKAHMKRSKIAEAMWDCSRLQGRVQQRRKTRCGRTGRKAGARRSISVKRPKKKNQVRTSGTELNCPMISLCRYEVMPSGGL
jgi:hypothetical protein